MTIRNHSCPECRQTNVSQSRREFLATVGAGVAWTAACRGSELIGAAPPAAKPCETLVKALYDSLAAQQKKIVCFDWDYLDPDRGLLRTRVSNNWRITPPAVKSDFYTADQQAMIRAVFQSMIEPAWHERFDRQLQDDTGGFGNRQSIALFGRPQEGKFEFVLTGRHMTLRCDGNSAEHVAFGGPIFYGHAAGGNNEKPDHPGNVFWPQAVAANEVFKLLDGRQRKLALVDRAPAESDVPFRGPSGELPGIPVAELSRDQKDALQKVLAKLIEPYRQSDREEVLQCLKVQGGLDRLHLAFYREGDIGNDQVWDVWRLEGPAFVWHWRGAPHVHVWVNIADDPAVKLNAAG